jgi:tetratricopeptide (TPR) repeat protein
MNCKTCNAEIAENAKFCTECGAKVEREPVCSNCGVKLTAGAKFCLECGTPVKNTAKPVFCAECGAKAGAVNRDVVTRNTSSDKAENPRVREHIDKAEELVGEEKYGKAIAEYTRALAIEPENTKTLIGRGEAYSGASEYGKARTDFQKAVHLAEAGNDTGTMAEAYDDLGDTYYSEKKYKKAIEFYEEAIALDDKEAFYYIHCGEAYLLDGDEDEAEEYFERAIELDPETSDVVTTEYWIHGFRYYREEKYDKAIEFYKKAISLDDKDAHYYQSCGNAYLADGNEDEAEEYFERAIELDPDLEEEIEEFKNSSANSFQYNADTKTMTCRCPACGEVSEFIDETKKDGIVKSYLKSFVKELNHPLKAIVKEFKNFTIAGIAVWVCESCGQKVVFCENCNTLVLYEDRDSIAVCNNCNAECGVVD